MMNNLASTPVRFCKLCGQPIPEARLQALPAATTCVKDSNASKVAGYQVITGKNTYTELQITTQEEAARLYAFGARKGHGINKGMQRSYKP